MPSRGTRGRLIRVDDDLWKAYLEVCKMEGTTGSEDIREHIRRRVAEQQRDTTPPADD